MQSQLIWFFSHPLFPFLFRCCTMNSSSTKVQAELLTISIHLLFFLPHPHTHTHTHTHTHSLSLSLSYLTLIVSFKFARTHTGLKVRTTTESGVKSTEEAVLVKLASLHPLPNIILQHRSLTKLLSTYLGAAYMYSGTNRDRFLFRNF